jgi:DNA polymerase-3 subunit epsilon
VPLPESWKTAAFIDVETTGFARTDEIIELAIVLFCFDSQTGEITACIDEYVGLREPTVVINPAAAAVNNLSVEHLRGQRLNEIRIETMLDRAEFIVAHNAPFDRRFVAPLFYGARNRPWLCSMSSVDWLRHGMPSRALQTLLEAHGITPQQAHRAAADVHATIDLLAARSPEGTPYFAEVLSKAKLQSTRPQGQSPRKPRKTPVRKTRAAGSAEQAG